MQDLNDKITGSTLTATEWNELPTEVQNVIVALNITLSSSDLNQLGKGIAGYVANGNFYIDSGIADAYVVSTIGSKQSPPQYTDGMEVIFIAGNRNLTASPTVNVAALGVKSITLAPIQSMEGITRLKYNSGAGSFTLMGSHGHQRIGQGVKGNPQTNVAYQIHRDITNNGGSSHGFNCADFFSDDLEALNPFGSDIQIGDGTQTTEVLNHVNDFQVTDKVNLGTADITNYRAYTAQTLLESGTMGSVFAFVASDVLGGRDTPGFSTPNFEVAGPAVVGNQTGLSTLIRHGSNPRSIHCAAGNTDAGALLNSGGAPVDLECPVVVRQATATISKASGALICTAGGIGIDGAIFGGDDISVVGATPIVRLRDAGNVVIGSIFHNATDLLINNHLNNKLKLGLNNVAVLELHTDRHIPSVTATLNSGDTTHRWIQSFVTIAENVSSDVNTKTEIENILDVLLDAWGDVMVKTYKRKLSVQAKGDSARIHAGYIAQDVEKAFEDKGLNAFDYSLISYDEMTEEVEETRLIEVQKTEEVEVENITFERDGKGGLLRKVEKVKEEQPVYERLNVLNEDGTPYMVEQPKQVDVGLVDNDGKKIFKTVIEMVPLVQEILVMIETEETYTETVKTGEKQMGLRYTECLVIEAAYLRREIARLKK